MKVHFEDRDWNLDLSDINLKPAIVIQSYMGMSINKWVDSLNDEADADGNIVKAAADSPEFLKSVGAVYWLMKAQNGAQCPIGDVDFPLGAFTQAMADAQAAEEPEADGQPDEPDPTTLPPPASEPSPESASIPTPQPSETPAEPGFPDG
jgi:hypothetical protein